MAPRQAAVSLQRDGPTGPTHGAAENNPRVMVTRRESDQYFTKHDPTRPVTFEHLTTRPDPIREI